MCGLTGFIGQSLNPKLSFRLITKLLAKSESRGVDATGYWGVANQQVFFHKEPMTAALFVKRDYWKKLENHNFSVLLAHARGASKGFGDPLNNENNHPFVSQDRKIGLIHNGRIDDFEYQNLRKTYPVTTECDSEILLRIFENTEVHLEGVRDIFSNVSDGHMAVAIGEASGNLWLFRNAHRPLWIVDVRRSLGQIFFISEIGFWDDALSECEARDVFESQRLICLPSEEVWHFKYNSGDISLEKYEVSKEISRPIFRPRLL